MKTLIALSMLILTAACAKSSDSSPTAAAASGTGVAGLGNGTNAGCNTFYDSTARLAGKLELYYSGGTTFSENQMAVRVTQVSSTFETANYNLQFFRWKSDSAGNTSLDSTPLSFTLYYNGSALTSSMTSLSGSTVASLRSTNSIGSSTVDFFQRVTLVVDGVDNAWQVMKIVEYSGSSPVLSTDALMPAFIANPTTYAASHPAVLSGLHPFYGQSSTNSTDAQWVALANQNCF